MNIKDLPQEALAKILEGLVKDGKVAEVDMLSLVVSAPTDEVKGITDMLHSICCNQKHGDEPDMCDYYTEDNLFECWELPTHKEWLNDVANLMRQYDIKSVKEMRDALLSVTELLRKLSELRAVSVPRYQLVATIIHGHLCNVLGIVNPSSEDSSDTLPLAY